MVRAHRYPPVVRFRQYPTREQEVLLTQQLTEADVNAARNIAAGRAVTARGGPVLAGLVNREPQRETSSVT